MSKSKRQEGEGYVRWMVRRLRTADTVDWLYSVLWIVVGISIASVIYVNTGDDGMDWAALSFVRPAQVQTVDGVKPQVDDLPAPSFAGADPIPVQLTRILDCAVFECPEGQLDVIASSEWLRVNPEGQIISEEEIPAAQEVGASIQEGIGYERGKLLPVVLNFEVPIPAEVRATAAEGVSAWVISGTVTPLVDDGRPAVWQTEVIHIGPVRGDSE